METPKLMKKVIEKYLKEGKRFDGREAMEHREIIIETGISKNAEGSARVRIGKTEVVAGVKLDVGEPYTDSPESGTLITTVELLPLSSPEFEYGRPGIEAIEIARIVDRGIRESGFIDLDKLCIKKGEKVWNVFIDLYSMNDDGNLLDAACLAGVAAVLDSKMPKYDEKEEKVLFGEWTSKRIPLTKNIPLTVTFYKLGDEFIIDPDQEEEASCEARISLCFSEDKKLLINALQKGEKNPLTTAELFKIIGSAEKKYKDIHSEVSKLLKRLE